MAERRRDQAQEVLNAMGPAVDRIDAVTKHLKVVMELADIAADVSLSSLPLQ